MAMVALNVLSLLFVHGALPKKSTVWAFSFSFNNVTLRFRKLFCHWSQILNLGSNSDTFTNERNVVGYERGGEGEGGVRSTITLPNGEYDNQYVHHSETWRLLHLNEGLETICGSTPLDARIEHCLAAFVQWTVCLVFWHYGFPRIIFQDQQERWQADVIFTGYPVPPPPLPLLKSSRVAILGVLCLWMVPLVLFLFFPDNLNTKACNPTPCLAVFLDRIILISWATNYCNCTAVCFMFLGACVG